MTQQTNSTQNGSEIARGKKMDKNDNDLNWEQMLCPSETNIHKLGSLMRETFKMNDVAFPQERGFRFQNNSLRASLLQISDVCYAAFNAAHNNMDRIRLTALNVPHHVESAVQMITDGNVEADQSQMVVKSSRIGASNMEEGVRLSENVVDAFTKAISLIEETMEAIRLASSNHDVKEATKTREILQQKEERILQRLEELKAKNDGVRSEMKSAQKDLEKAVMDVPPTWTIMATQLADVMKDVLLPMIRNPRVSLSSAFSKSYDYMNSVNSISELKQEIETKLTADHIFTSVHERMEEIKEQMINQQNDIAYTEKYILEATNELMEVRAQIRRLPSTNAHLKQTLSLLKDGLDNLNQLKQSWTQLSIFFKSYRTKDYDSDEEEPMEKARQDCNFIINIAETYIYFSQNHILPYMCRLDSSLFDEC